MPEQIVYSIMGPAQEVWLAADIVRLFQLKDARALARLIGQGRFPTARRGVGKQAFWTGEDVACFLKLSGRFIPKKNKPKEPPAEKKS